MCADARPSRRVASAFESFLGLVPEVYSRRFTTADAPALAAVLELSEDAYLKLAGTANEGVQAAVSKALRARARDARSQTALVARHLVALASDDADKARAVWGTLDQSTREDVRAYAREELPHRRGHPAEIMESAIGFEPEREAAAAHKALRAGGLAPESLLRLYQADRGAFWEFWAQLDPGARAAEGDRLLDYAATRGTPFLHERLREELAAHSEHRQLDAGHSAVARLTDSYDHHRFESGNHAHQRRIEAAAHALPASAEYDCWRYLSGDAGVRDDDEARAEAHALIANPRHRHRIHCPSARDSTEAREQAVFAYARRHPDAVAAWLRGDAAQAPPGLLAVEERAGLRPSLAGFLVDPELRPDDSVDVDKELVELPEDADVRELAQGLLDRSRPDFRLPPVGTGARVGM